ncbi:MAG: bifunctional hydroxymethylpyrimidine kinase/phosphomethylpyrimidine kinase [Acidobacteriota bacterium]
MGDIPRVLSIAGSDSGGGAGIQADLKTFAALGVHGMTAVTSVTAQDTRRVHMASDLPLDNIRLQIKAVIDDIGVDAVKTGMLSSAEIISLVARAMKRYRIDRLVVDPVMISTGGDALIQPDAVDALKIDLFPLAIVVTPNLPEAQFLTGRQVRSREQIEKAIQEIFEMGPRSVILKGGHLDDPSASTDYFFDGKTVKEFAGPRIDTANTHGSGCTFASAIAAYLAQGLELEEAVFQAKEYVSHAIQHSFSLGRGSGPLGHFWKR